MDDKLYLLFFIFWGIYELARCTESATLADPYCEIGSGTFQKACDGYNTAAAMFFFAFASSCAAAFFYRAKDNNMYLCAVVSLIFDAFGWAGNFGAPSQVICDNPVTDAQEKRCSGYEAATAFFVFAGFAYIGMAILIRPGQTVVAKLPFMAFFGALAFYALGFLSFSGGESAASCDGTGNVAEIYCGGYGFAAFMFCMAFIAALIILFFVFTQGETIASFWRHVLVYLTIFFFSFMVLFGTTANAENSDSTDTNDGSASGNGFATFAMLIAFLILLVHSLSPFFNADLYGPNKHTVFFLAMCLFAMSYCAVFGGSSKDGCDAGDDDFNKNYCDGYAMASFFSFVAFVVMAAAVYFAHVDPSKNDSSDEKQQEIDQGNQIQQPVEDKA